MKLLNLLIYTAFLAQASIEAKAGGEFSEIVGTNITRIVVDFGNERVLTFQEVRSVAIDAIIRKGYSPLTNSPCSISVILKPKPQCVVLFYDLDRNRSRARKLQQVKIGADGKVLEVVEGGKETEQK